MGAKPNQPENRSTFKLIDQNEIREYMTIAMVSPVRLELMVSKSSRKLTI